MQILQFTFYKLCTITTLMHSVH